MPTDPTRAVFLSYASQDAEAARRICDTLRASGVEVWFDADGGLEHGDEWDAKIRRQIKECVLFIPVISANTQARHEGYFRIEWDLAAERARGIASGVPFILPVVIDDTREPDALVPDRFRAVQWTKLRAGEVPPEVQQRFLKLWSHRTGVLKHEAQEVARAFQPVGSDDTGSKARATPEVGRRVPAAAWIAAAALIIAALTVWKFWPGAASVPRDSELQRAAALFDFNSPDSTAEGFALAEDILKSVLAKRPSDTEAVILYAWLNDLFMIRGFDLSEERRSLARQYTERALRLAPLNADALAAQGVFYSTGYIGRDPARAEQLLRQAISINPRDPRYHRILSFALADQDKRDEARRNARHALELFPDNALVHYDYGLVQLYLDDFDGAEKAFRDTLAFTPSSSLLYGNLHADLASFAAFAHADLSLMKSWLDKMPSQFRDGAREAMPSFIYALASGDTERALASVRQLPNAWLRNYGETPKALIAGDLLMLQGKPEQARGEFEAAHAEVTQARVKDPGKSRFRQLEMWTLLRLGRLAEARAALPGVIEATSPQGFDPLYPTEYWYGPLAASLALGDKASALSYLRKAATTAGWRRYFSNLIKIDPRVKDWRSDPEIVALLSDSTKSSAIPAPAPADKSIAVLPFANKSDDKANEYFSDGISEELGVVLGKVPGLRMAGWNSSLSFKGQNVPEAEIAQKLGVTHIVSGSVGRDGTQVRITARLVNAADGFSLWSESFKREAKDIFAVQDEMAGLIAEKLKLKLGVDARRSRAVNPEAHRLVLEGRHFWNQRNEDGFARAETAFLKAIEIDQTFAEAHAGLAGVYVVRGTYDAVDESTRVRREEDFQRARIAATKAVEFGPDLAESHAVLAYTLFNQGDQVAAEREFEQALTLNPNSTTAITWSSVFQTSRGRLDLALRGYAKSAELDPLWFINLHLHSEELYYAGRYDEALRMAERAAGLRSDTFMPNLGIRAATLFALGRRDEAVRLARQITANLNADTRWIADVHAIHVLRKSGAAAEAESHATETLRRLRPTSPVRWQVFIALEKFEEAMQAIGGYHATMPRFLFWEPTLDPWRNDPRFHAALARLGCAEDYKVARETLARLKAESAAKK